jgi:hypothetical protein
MHPDRLFVALAVIPAQALPEELTARQDENGEWAAPNRAAATDPYHRSRNTPGSLWTLRVAPTLVEEKHTHQHQANQQAAAHNTNLRSLTQPIPN